MVECNLAEVDVRVQFPSFAPEFPWIRHPKKYFLRFSDLFKVCKRVCLERREAAACIPVRIPECGVVAFRLISGRLASISESIKARFKTWFVLFYG